ncbi:MAG TPA: hypothetical protein VGA98_01825 [Allosphingosinicella sp.]|jgi:hypothetical protein
MLRLFTSCLIAFLLALAFVSGAAMAAPGAGYRAEPARPPASAKLIVKGIVWKCGAAGCSAARGNSRPAIDCSALAREVGTLRSFAADGRALEPAALEKCNARAREF